MRSIVTALAAMAWLTLGGVIVTDRALAEDHDKLVCSLERWVGFGPVLLARRLGYFEEQGLDFEPVSTSQTEALAALGRGEIDCYLRSLGEHITHPLTADAPVSIIGTIDVSQGGDAVVSTGDIDTVCDLEGRVYASDPALPATLLLRIALKEQCGLTLDDLTFKEIDLMDGAKAMSDPEVSAVGTFEPLLTQAIKENRNRGAKVLISSFDHPGLIVDVIVAQNDRLRDRPESFVKLLRGIYRAIDYFETDKDEALAIMASEFEISSEHLEEALMNVTFTDLDQSIAFMGSEGETGTLHGHIGKMAGLHAEHDGSEVRILAHEHIDNGPISKVAANPGK